MTNIRTGLDSDPGQSGPVHAMSTCHVIPVQHWSYQHHTVELLYMSVYRHNLTVLLSFCFIFCLLFLLLQTTVKLWPVKPVVWSSPTISSGSRSGRRCPIRRVSSTRPSEWPICCSTSLRWNVPKVTASRRSTRWGRQTHTDKHHTLIISYFY